MKAIIHYSSTTQNDYTLAVDNKYVDRKAPVGIFYVNTKQDVILAKHYNSKFACLYNWQYADDCRSFGVIPLLFLDRHSANTDADFLYDPALLLSKGVKLRKLPPKISALVISDFKHGRGFVGLGLGSSNIINIMSDYSSIHIIYPRIHIPIWSSTTKDQMLADFLGVYKSVSVST